jgi:hypothetical protein
MAIGDGSLEVRYLDTFSFGSHTVRFYYCGPDGEAFLAQTELRNDGANLAPSNFELVEAEDGQLQIIVKGAEQDDEHWSIHTAGGQVRMKKIDS